MTNDALRDPASLIELGHVSDAYGVRGAVKVHPYSARSEALLSSRQWWLRKENSIKTVQVVSARRHGAVVAASFEGVLDRDQALAFRGWQVLLPRAAFPETSDDEFYWVDLIDCAVTGLNEAGERVQLGMVADVSDNGAHALLHVRRVHPVAPGEASEPLLDAKGKVQLSLIPFVAAHVGNVDVAAKQIETSWPSAF